ncbi:MAG TPA: Rrf2 family transcriptional regulator [Syntrophales bacterium]|nr:Rrf2 family transcriptional regulator [Syntrophales bacterium]
MNLSTKGRYAVRALLDLALRSGTGPVVVRDISERQEISGLYLVQLFNRLKAAGFVRSVRGSRGGFELARRPRDIRIMDVLRVMEGSTVVADCVGNGDRCSRSGSCKTRTLWMKIQKTTDEILRETTLEDLMVMDDHP